MPATWFKISTLAFLSSLACLGTCGLNGCSKRNQNSAQEIIAPLKFPNDWSANHQSGALQESWLTQFNDQTLLGLIDESLEHNFDLQIQLARWQQFEARSRLAGAEKRPQVSANANIARRYQESTLLDDYNTDYSVGLNLSWELDIWGKLSDRSQAAVLLEEASANDYQALRLSIAARISQAWYACIFNHLQIDLLQQTIAAWDKTILSAQAQFNSGVMGALDVQRLLQARNADAAGLTERLQEFENRKRDLELILGRYPSADIECAAALPVLSASVPADQPSTLLNRRHDLAAAKQRYDAAIKQTNAAEKDQLPSFRLTADAGYASDELQTVFKPSSFFWNALAGITAPIFQGGRLRATVSLRQAESSEAAAQWAKIALQAFYEVENCLSNELFIRKRLQELADSVHYAQLSHQQAQEQFNNGLIGIADALDIQRNWLNIQIRQLIAQHALIANRIDLHKALGGDFIYEKSVDQ